jgi:hypothetical protein
VCNEAKVERGQVDLWRFHSEGRLLQSRAHPSDVVCRNGVIDRNELKILLESLDGGNENILEVCLFSPVAHLHSGEGAGGL